MVMFQGIWKFGLVAVAALLAAGWTGAASAADDGAGASRILIVYFSHSGVTKGIAERLQGKLGAALYRIEPVEAYPETYQEVLDKARPEVEGGVKVELKGDLPKLEGVDLVLVGGPVWFGTMAPPLSSFLAQVDLKDKTVAPFCTYGGGLGGYFDHVKAALPEEATVLDGLGLGRADLAKEAEVETLIGEWAAKLPAPAVE
jgi:flavodoxin